MNIHYHYSHEVKRRELYRSEFDLYYIQNRDLFEPEESEFTYDQILEIELREACVKADIAHLQVELSEG